MANALAATRLSHKTDESTSIERQKEQTSLTAKVRGDKLIYTTEDTDVSGAVSPFFRESLGPWLTDPEKIAQWDVLIVAKLDRLTRSLSDFDEMVKWLDSHGKTLVSVSESIDLSSSTGRMLSNLLAMFAQFERERMSERRREAAVKIRDNGWWAGFGHPYGTRPVKKPDHWELEIDPVTYERLEQIGYEIIRGSSASKIAKSLNARDVPTPAGGKEWRQNTIRDIFASDKCVLDEDLLARVREALDTTKQAWTKRGDSALLLNVAHCECGAQMYSKRYTSKGRLYEYYDCSAKCGAKRVPMAALEATVNDIMTDADLPVGFASYPVWRKNVTGGKSAKSELGKIERQLHTLDFDAPDFHERQAELLAQRRTLREAQSQPGETTYEQEQGMTVSAHWPTLDGQAKRQLLLEAGVTVRVTERGVKRVHVEVMAPVDVRFVLLPSGALSAA